MASAPYDENRRIGRAPERPGLAGGGFRPTFSATLTLFGEDVTLGLGHLFAVFATGVVAGTEGVVALVVLYLGFLYMKSAPPTAAATAPGAGTARTRPRQPRAPGIAGWLRHAFGPLPEGPAITIGGAEDSGEATAAPAPAQAVGRPAVPAAAPAGRALGGASCSSAASTASPDARAAAARAAAARAAAARAAES